MVHDSEPRLTDEIKTLENIHGKLANLKKYVQQSTPQPGSTTSKFSLLTIKQRLENQCNDIKEVLYNVAIEFSNSPHWNNEKVDKLGKLYSSFNFEEPLVKVSTEVVKYKEKSDSMTPREQTKLYLGICSKFCVLLDECSKSMEDALDLAKATVKITNPDIYGIFGKSYKNADSTKVQSKQKQESESEPETETNSEELIAKL